ncbi:class I adenylate-forming enzyme family protein [uncultured Hyphomonas sp.]|uniref:class I adenylate-forming enzyme family protein n=1 Tax=uncultured Hyphomonas sp. TaxID=225298 RepID=UPI002AAAFEA9|nr:class I adenylate-forming enzyme family protein [uncultured Hyphomonas sp.]
MMSATDLLFSIHDETPAIARGDQLHTRGDIRAAADALAGRLTADGITRFLVHSDDSFLIVQAILAGADTRADVFIAHTSLSAEQVEAICQEQQVQHVLTDLPASGDIALPAGDRMPGEGRIFMMTSGTTGMPKIASHTLPGLIARAKSGHRRRPENGGRWLLTYQPTGFAGLQVTLTAALWGGLLITPAERTMSGFYQAVRKWGATHISATPTFWRSFLMMADPSDLPLQQITLGGEAADQATLDRIRRAFPDLRITHTYASTEAGVVYAVHDGREGFPAEWLTSPPNGVQLRIIDGFLQIRTPNMMKGYVSAQAQPLLEDGWLSTADLAVIEGDRVRILGRDDSTINVAGSKVYPLPVEALILEQPGVVEARVYGVPNPVAGALVAADIVLEAGQEEKASRKVILSACREQLAGYQVPRILNFVESIAVSASNKKG